MAYQFKTIETVPVTIDIATTYNMIIERGIDSQLLKAPQLKDNGLSINWADENGTERYLGNPKFESKAYTIQCLIQADSKANVITKLELLKTFLMTKGLFEFRDTSKGRYWKLHYSNMPSLVIGNTYARFTLELIDDYPTSTFTI